MLETIKRNEFYSRELLLNAFCDGLRAPILIVSLPPYLPPFSFPPRSYSTSETFFFSFFSMALHHVIYCSSWFFFFVWADIISSSVYRCQPLCMLCISICKFDIPILTMHQIIFIYNIMLTNDPYEYVLFLDVIVHYVILYMYADKPNKFNSTNAF